MSKSRKARGNHRQLSNKSNLWLYVGAALAATLILAGAGMLFWLGQESTTGTALASNPASAHNNQPAPDFTLTSLGGESVSLSDYAGQVILVNMWATWCPPCKAEMPAINDFYEARRQDGFTVLAVNSQEDKKTVGAFIEDNGFTFPVLLDTEAEVMTRYQVRGLPTTFIIDRNGVIQHIQTGAINGQQLEVMVAPLLSGS